jgi:hypothetical protein
LLAAVAVAVKTAAVAAVAAEVIENHNDLKLHLYIQLHLYIPTHL